MSKQQWLDELDRRITEQRQHLEDIVRKMVPDFPMSAIRITVGLDELIRLLGIASESESVPDYEKGYKSCSVCRVISHFKEPQRHKDLCYFSDKWVPK